ncbi:uncharacterized protein EV420DRAFT_1482562 [Desarmillaria tabescens]|uniref:Uncharacterized protein n=1 Tax=Armillaria tabescens TaxID=1929756 RepID=A0AA39K2Q6_ARMTA|nr:uncharacterized protein EV420DRAFT_1482562 [Desarmillaria tabescens]KAK0451153.1 hypothetical protein EV420DRAFT_1482562 [Desarmillaria tabescens]
MRTALTGTAYYLDALVLAPGMHQLVTSIGRTGHLVTAKVTPNPSLDEKMSRNNRRIQSFVVAGIPAVVLYLLCPVLTIAVFALLGVIEDWWGFGVLWMLVLARLINVVIIKQRSIMGWKGAHEDDDGDLLILLSQDRWVRLRGSIDGLKAVTAGQWLREMTDIESFAVAFATFSTGSLLIAGLLLSSVALLGLCNSMTKCLQMYDLIVRVEGKPKWYERRLDMVKELVKETGRKDWAICMRLMVEEDSPQAVSP